jgi:FAD/FMN-containing dehydrogenase
MICLREHAPIAYAARGLEKLLIFTKETENPTLHRIACLSAKAIGLTIVPMCLLAELITEPLFLLKAKIQHSKENWDYNIERIDKLALGIFCTPLAILAADAVSYLFLERSSTPKAIRPFGVEKIYGEKIDTAVYQPTSTEEVQKIVLEAKAKQKSIAILGAGFSQGEQTIPTDKKSIALDLRNLKGFEFVPESDHHLVKVKAGTTWEELQKFVNQAGKSVIVKQASDIFSIGGSIGINCHGWEHAFGAIASTVESLEVIDAEGNLRTLSLDAPSLEDRELFRCMFGTMGYFGVIVSATLRLKDNEMYQEKGVKVPLEEFDSYYKEHIQKNDKIPLLIGRLRLDGTPLKELYLNTYESVEQDHSKPLITPCFEIEPCKGQRINRIFLDAIGHLPDLLFKPLIGWFWSREVKLMEELRIASRNEILHFGLKSFVQMHQSDLYTQWLQEYFISEENLPSFLEYLGKVLEKNGVRLLNASIRPTPKDEISILPYAEKNRYAIVLSFHQLKTKQAIEATKKWIQEVHQELLSKKDKWYQAYMPFASQEEFIACYGKDRIEKMRELKKKFDPENRFSSKHTYKYYDAKEGETA